MKRIILSTSLLLIALSSFAQGSLEGIITDVDTGEILSNYLVSVYKNDVLKHEYYSGSKGEFKVTPLDPGSYTVTLQALGCCVSTIQNIIIYDNQTTRLNFSDSKIHCSPHLCQPTIILASSPLLESEPYVSGQTFTAEDIYRRRGAE